MTNDKGKHGHRHPDAVAYLEDPGQEGAAVVRPYEGGHVRYWMEGGEVLSLDVADDGPVLAEFGRRLPKLAAGLASGGRASPTRSWRSATPPSAAAALR